MRLNNQNLRKPTVMVPETAGLTRAQREWVSTFDKATRMYLEDKRVNNESEVTIENATRRIRQFRVYMIDKEGCRSITPETLYGFRKWLIERQLKTSTVREYIKGVCAFLDWCTWPEHKFYDIDIPPHIIPRRQQTVYMKTLSYEEIVKMIELPTGKTGRITKSFFYIRRRAIALTLMMCGLRASELCMLDAKDFDVDRGTLYVRHGKGMKQRLLNVPKALYDTLQMYYEEGTHPDFHENPDAPFFGMDADGEWVRLTRFHVYDFVKSYTLETIGKPLNPHALRHVAASFTFLSGASLEEVRQFLGHGDTNTTKIYLQKMFQVVAAPGIENLWDRIDYESEKVVRTAEERNGVKIRRLVVDREYILTAYNGDEEYELNITAESEESARMKALVYCNRNGMKLKERHDGTIVIKEKTE